jgi:hypothetical protein
MPRLKQVSITMPKILAAAFVLFASIIPASTVCAANATEGIVIYNPLDGVTVVTVSSDLEEEGAAGEAPAVNVINQVNVVNVVVPRRFYGLRCAIGVPYPWLRRRCGDPLYPF